LAPLNDLIGAYKDKPDVIIGDFNSVFAEDREVLKEFLKEQIRYIKSFLNSKLGPTDDQICKVLALAPRTNQATSQRRVPSHPIAR
jgi:hypothetical protein